MIKTPVLTWTRRLVLLNLDSLRFLATPFQPPCRARRRWRAAPRSESWRWWDGVTFVTFLEVAMSVASSWSNGYCYTPLTPRSSTDINSSARSTGYRAAAPAVETTSAPKPIDRPSRTQAAPISQLHTPAPSVDINPKAIKVFFRLSLQSVITNLCQLFDDIKHLDFAAYGQVFVRTQMSAFGLYSLCLDV